MEMYLIILFWRQQITHLAFLLLQFYIFFFTWLLDNPQVKGIIVAISKGESDKYGVSNPKELKVRSIFSQALSATDKTLRTPNVCFQLETRNKTTLWV